MEIKKEFPHINFLEKEPMSRHTTFRIGGPAGLLRLYRLRMWRHWYRIARPMTSRSPS